jgi:hypothetical protein
VTFASIRSVTSFASGKFGRYLASLSSRDSLPSSSSCSSRLIRYGIAIDPIRKYIFGEAGLPFIELPKPAFTSGCSPVSTRMIVARSPSSGIASRTIASMWWRAPSRPTQPVETCSCPLAQSAALAVPTNETASATQTISAANETFDPLPKMAGILWGQDGGTQSNVRGMTRSRGSSKKVVKASTDVPVIPASVRRSPDSRLIL